MYHRPPNLQILRWIRLVASIRVSSRTLHPHYSLYAQSPLPFFPSLSVNVPSPGCYSFLLFFFFYEWVHRVTAEVTSSDSSLSHGAQFPVPFPPLPFIHKKKRKKQQTSMKREVMGWRLDSMRRSVESFIFLFTQITFSSSFRVILPVLALLFVMTHIDFLYFVVCIISVVPFCINSPQTECPCVYSVMLSS